MSLMVALFFLVDSHLDRKLCCGVLHDPQLFLSFLFQSIAILTAVALVYLFREKAIELFTISICITNTAIMLMSVPGYGVAASLQSLITCLVTFGDADGYALQLEIHDLTFVFGQMVLYYTVFAPHDTQQEKRKRRRYLLACCWFFLVGMKRSAIPAVLLFVLIALFFRKRKVPSWVYPTVGGCCILFFLAFLYCVRNGIISRLLNSVGVDMMGRDYLWSMANPYYELSITYFGHGFEYVDTIISQWYDAGLINQPFPFHNDILKVFVEMGFPGFLLWSGIQYVLTPLFWQRYADKPVSKKIILCKHSDSRGPSQACCCWRPPLPQPHAATTTTKTTATLTVGTDNILLGAEAGASETFTVTTTAAWKAVASGGGFSLDRTEGSGDATIRVTAAAAGANGEEKRLGSIAIAATGVDGVKTVTVSQQGTAPEPLPGDITLIVDFTQGASVTTPELPPYSKDNFTTGRHEYTVKGYQFAIFVDKAEGGKFYWIDNTQFSENIPEPNKGLFFSKLGAYVEFPAIQGKNAFGSPLSAYDPTERRRVGTDGRRRLGSAVFARLRNRRHVGLHADRSPGGHTVPDRDHQHEECAAGETHARLLRCGIAHLPAGVQGRDRQRGDDRHDRLPPLPRG